MLGRIPWYACQHSKNSQVFILKPIIHNRGYLGFACWHSNVSIRTIRTNRSVNCLNYAIVFIQQVATIRDRTVKFDLELDNYVNYVHYGVRTSLH